MVRESSDERIDHRRRRALQVLAATGVGLAGIGQASAGHHPDEAGGDAASFGGNPVEFQGHTVWPVGGATLDLAEGGDVLHVGDLGAGGGVAASVDSEESYGFTMQPTPLSEESAHLTAHPRGVVDGDNRRLGAVGLVRQDDVLALGGHFDPLGADALRVGLYRDGDLVEELVREPGEIGHLHDDPWTWYCPTWPWPPWCPPCPWPPWPPWAEFRFGSAFDDGEPIPHPMHTGGEEFLVDAVRVGAEFNGDPISHPMDGFGPTEILAGGIEEYVLEAGGPTMP